MTKAPFKRFIVTFLLFNKSVNFVVTKLKSFGYEVKDDEVSEIFKELRNTLPQKYKELIESGGSFNLGDDGHVQWLKTLGVFEYYDFISRKSENLEDPPNYFKWCDDCLWVHGYRDVMTLINILLFNEEDLEEISKIIMFKYRKKIGVDALELYKKVFWETESVTAKEAFYHCIPFRNNALIVRQLRSGDAEITSVNSTDEMHDGSDVPFTFHDTNYIKWKIGYREVSVPTPRDFLEQVKNDSYFKYYESLNMSRSVESEHEEGTNDKIGAFDSTKTKKRNVEENRAKLMKHYLDLYLKAEGSMPAGGANVDDFFKKMKQLDLDFEDEEKMARIDDLPEVLNDIKGDISDLGVMENNE